VGCLREALDLVAQIMKVVLADMQVEDFINDGSEVSQGANRGERRRVTGAEEAAGGGQQQGVLNCNQRHGAFIKLSASNLDVLNSHLVSVQTQ